MRKSLFEYCIAVGEEKLLEQWDEDRNGTTAPATISYGSHRRVWWRCELGHQWDAVVYTRTLGKAGCPYCSGKRLLPDTHSLASDYPGLAAQWHPTKNQDLRPDHVPPGTHRKVWWICDRGHEWQAEVKSRVAGSGCPICTNRRVLAGENDLGTTHPELAAQWHPTKNGSLTAQSVSAGAAKKVWWRCERGHEWKATICSRTSESTGCPVCASKQVQAGENDLATTFPKLASQWHPTKNGRMTPQSVTAYSNRKAWWICEKGHEYQAVIAQRATASTDCPYCAGRKVLAGFNDLATKEPLVSAQWHPELNGGLTAQDVTCGSTKKVWWQCDEGHVWKAVIYSRAGAQKCGCPVCAGKVKEARRIRYGKQWTP